VAAGAAAVLCVVAVVLSGCYPGAHAASATSSSGTWRTQTSGSSQRLYDVACLSALRCEAVGAAGTIVATANGGRTWRPQANPLRGSATPLYAISCVAPSSCYAIGRPNTILVTHNGGASWSRHVLSGVSGSTTLTDQGCLPNYAPIAGRAALCRLGLLDVSCVSASVCEAVATAPPAYAATPIPKTPHAAASSIWLTRDGGNKWTRQPIPSGVPCNGDCSGLYGYPLEWVTCLSSGLCRAGGGTLLDCGHCGFAYAVLVAHAVGQSWKCTQPGCGGGTWGQLGPQVGWGKSVLNGITCPSALTCYLAGTGGSIARITHGTTMAAQHTPTSRDLYGITCEGPDACYAVGDHGTILALG
jgi:photosystem II stability/assembly factor-like uncharacterized protein